MDGQLSLFDMDFSNDEFKQYIGKCEYCLWGDNEKTCDWSVNNDDKYSYKRCHSRNLWRPNDIRIPKLCSTCEYSNPFVYEPKPEYENKPREAAYDPQDLPNIYCDRCGGPVNRSQPFLEYYVPKFGVGLWDRQHELDTCDAYKLDSIWKNERR